MTVTPLPPELPPERHRRATGWGRGVWAQAASEGIPVRAVSVIFGLYLLDQFDQSGFGVILPNVQQRFGLSLAAITSIGAVSALGGILLAVPVAFRSDRTSHRVLFMVVATAVAGAFSVLAGIATGVVLFALARSGTRVGLANNEPLEQSLLADYSPIDRRPAIYSGRAIAFAAGGILGPLAYGGITALAGYQWAVSIQALPLLALAVIAMRMPEPARGHHERRALGLSGDEQVADERPSWAESWEILKAVHSLRRLWLASPFLLGGFVALGSLMPLFQAHVFHLGPAGRGYLGSVTQVFGIAGLAVGLPLANRVLRGDHPERMFRLLAYSSVIVALLLVVVAEAPNLAVLTVASCLVLFVGATIAPGLLTAMSLVLSPRVRSFGFAVSGLWAIPGLVLLPVAGWVGDAYGLRIGLLCAIPVFLIGSLIAASGGTGFVADMRANVVGAAAAVEDRRARAEERPKLLVCRGVEASYGPVQVLFDVDFDVEEGEMVALLGTNGAGKSTLLRTISGELQPSAGAIVFDGRTITRTVAAQAIGLGIACVPSGRGVFPGLTVADNLRVASWPTRRDAATTRRRTDAVIDIFPVLGDRLGRRAGTLSGGEQQMLTLAQAFMARPRLLLVDELSLGLAPIVVGQLLEILQSLHRDGTTIVLVEQSVNIALAACDRAVFLDKGGVRFDGPAADLLDRPDVLRSVFFGNPPESDTQTRILAPSADVGSYRGGAAIGTQKIPNGLAGDATLRHDSPLLEARNLTKRYGGIIAVNDVSLALGHDEVVGVVGQNGAGKTTLFDLLSGFLAPDSGEVFINGVEANGWGPERRSRAGVGRSFQSAQLFNSLSVTETIKVACEQRLTVRDPLSVVLGLPVARDAERQVKELADDLVELTGLISFRHKLMSELSTGTRRIVDIACVLAQRPRILLLDEPSTGIAQRDVEALGPLLKWIQSESGVSLLLVEHDMSLVAAVADRIVALEAGSVIADGPCANVLADPVVIASYLGDSAVAVARSGTR